MIYWHNPALPFLMQAGTSDDVRLSAYRRTLAPILGEDVVTAPTSADDLLRTVAPKMLTLILDHHGLGDMVEWIIGDLGDDPLGDNTPLILSTLSALGTKTFWLALQLMLTTRSRGLADAVLVRAPKAANPEGGSA